jgi:hypothetical protein
MERATESGSQKPQELECTLITSSLLLILSSHLILVTAIKVHAYIS